MKKVLSFVMIAVLALTCMVMPAFAAETTTVSVATKNVEIGTETVTLDVIVSEATFATYEMKVEYDATALELTDIAQGAATNGVFVANVNNGEVAAADANDSTVSGVLFTLTFKVLTDVKGTYPVTVAVDNVVTANDTAVEVATKAGAVVIEAAPEVPNTGDATVVVLLAVAFGVLATGVTVSKRKLFN